MMRAILAIEPRMSEPVVPGSFLRIAQHLERLGRLFEPLDRLRVARILVRMILDRELTIRRRNLPIRGSSLDAQDFVIITLLRHGEELSITNKHSTKIEILSHAEAERTQRICFNFEPSP